MFENFSVGKIHNNAQTAPVSDNVSGEGYSQLESMKNGDTFTAKVVKTDGSDVTLRLPGGKLVGARLSSDMSLTEGQNVTFQVGKNASTISISPLLTNTATDISVLKALGQASIPVTDSSAQMVTEMMKAGISIDRSSVLDMYGNVMSNPSSPVSDIVDLARLGIPVNPENLENIDNYKNLSYQIDQGMQDIAAKTQEALLDLVKSGDGESAAKLMNTVLDTVLSHLSEIEDPVFSVSDQTETAAGDPLEEAQGSALDTGNVQVKDEGLLQAGEKNAAVTAQDLASNEPAPVLAGVNDPAARALELLKALQSASENDNPSAGEVPGKAEPSATDKTLPSDNSQKILSGSDNLRDAFDKTVSLMREITSDKEYNPASTAALLKDISILGRKGLESGDLSGIRKLLGSEDFRKLAFDTLKDEWRISPSEVADKEKVEALYKRLSGQLEMIKGGLETVHAVNTPAYNSINNMSSNIDFLQQINQMYAYIQLPLKLSGGDSAHGDLYVFSNRKNMASDDSTVTAFLHLDMDNLGPVDVYVSMDVGSGGKVSTSFTVADDETLDLLSEHMDMLTERLKGRGYDLSCSMKLKDSEDPEENALEAGGVNLLLLHTGGTSASFSSGMRSFDVRA